MSEGYEALNSSGGKEDHTNPSYTSEAVALKVMGMQAYNADREGNDPDTAKAIKAYAKSRADK